MEVQDELKNEDRMDSLGEDAENTDEKLSQAPSDTVGVEVKPEMSKRQLKKQAKLLKWKDNKPLRLEQRKKEKLKYTERRKQRLEDLKRQAAEDGIEPETVTDPTSRKNLKSNSMKNSTCKVGICIDMSFNDLMIEKDLNKCIKQLNRCYSVNRRYENPVQFYVTSFTGKAASVMGKNDGWRNWDVHFHEKSYLELDYPKEQIVYLTAESENVLREPEDGKLYVIGGLVDHNSKKGLCHKLALEKGVQHARLPLDEYIEMSARKVLSVDHVFEIIGGIAQKKQWEEVLLQAIPARTQPKLKSDIRAAETEDSSSNLSQTREDEGNEITKVETIEIESSSLTV
ncbi:tRNA methyltransferase 10 A [Orchesella cincta]|uniref:tRNA (guanine(9)-N(1))-methyltransferase n=1 Tax=Orchesella cincta TaxID=48709 RepID=A0A1D2NLP5_ORCCI|nr:tRNA methyltransferase 10 A [Orchesella cincta]